MVEQPPDIYAILESFLKENLGSKYDEQEMQELIGRAKALLRDRMEKEVRSEPESPGLTVRRPPLVSEPDLESKLLDSLKASIRKKEDGE